MKKNSIYLDKVILLIKIEIIRFNMKIINMKMAIGVGLLLLVADILIVALAN